jgi:hypothetical protein
MAQPSVTTTIPTSEGELTFECVNTANLNVFWGDLVDELAQSGIMGEHSSAAGAFTPDPGDGGRRGVGNVSMEDFAPDGTVAGTGDALAGGAQGFHATFNASLLGSPDLPPDIVEATVGPFFPEPVGNITEVTGATTLTDDWHIV